MVPSATMMFACVMLLIAVPTCAATIAHVLIMQWRNGRKYRAVITAASFTALLATGLILIVLFTH